jgi:hypothetical protein
MELGDSRIAGDGLQRSQIGPVARTAAARGQVCRFEEPGHNWARTNVSGTTMSVTSADNSKMKSLSGNEHDLQETCLCPPRLMGRKGPRQAPPRCRVDGMMGQTKD